MRRAGPRVGVPLLSLVIMLLAVSCAHANFYGEDRNGTLVILQADGNGVKSVWNTAGKRVFQAPNARRIAVLPTAGWGDTVVNQDPFGTDLPRSVGRGDPQGILTLRVIEGGSGVEYRLYRGPSTLLYTLRDHRRTTPAPFFDLAVSQYMGHANETIRAYLLLSDFDGAGPYIRRLEFTDNVCTGSGWRFAKCPSHAAPTGHWGHVDEHGSLLGAQSIDVNAVSDTDDLLVYHPTRHFALQHRWTTEATGGGIVHALIGSRVYRAPADDPLTHERERMVPVFDLDHDARVSAFADRIAGYHLATDHRTTFVERNTSYVNATLVHALGDPRAGREPQVDVRLDTWTGPTAYRAGFRPEAAILGNSAITFTLSVADCRSGDYLYLYEPVYRLDERAIAANAVVDRNNNNVADSWEDQDDLAFRDGFLVTRGPRPGLDPAYRLDYVVAHRFRIDPEGPTRFSYREVAVERNDGAPIPGATIAGTLVGNRLTLEVATNGCRNAGRLLGIEVMHCLPARGGYPHSPDFFGVAGNDNWQTGQGDLHVLVRDLGTFSAPWLGPDPGGWDRVHRRTVHHQLLHATWTPTGPRVTRSPGRQAIGAAYFLQTSAPADPDGNTMYYGPLIYSHEETLPLEDCAMVNIGAPPFNSGIVTPTIRADTGDVAAIHPNTPVRFTGHWRDPGRLVETATDAPQFRFVILDGALSDGNPAAAVTAKVVADSYLDERRAGRDGLLSTASWRFTFTGEMLKDATGNMRNSATFYVYLGIAYKSRDYAALPYPAYAWWPVPVTEKYTWSHSNGGAFTDGQAHDQWGAPLKITVDLEPNLTPETPLAVAAVEARSSADPAFAHDLAVAQDQHVQLRITGDLLFLAEVPQPQEALFGRMGGIAPYEGPLGNNTRIYMDAAGNQFDAGRGQAPIGMQSAEMARDCAQVEYDVYIRAKVLGARPDQDRPYSVASPTATSSNMLYETQPDDVAGYQCIAGGSLEAAAAAGRQRPALFPAVDPTTQAGPNRPVVRVTPNPTYSGRNANHRVFRFEIRTGWFQLPVPLDAGLPNGDLRDKYEVRVAFRYPVAHWTRMRLPTDNPAVVRSAFSAHRRQPAETVRTYSDVPAQAALPGFAAGYRPNHRCWIRVRDTAGPTVRGLAIDPEITTGEHFPAAAVGIQVCDNNPNDAFKRGGGDNAVVPHVGWIYSAGRDPQLHLIAEDRLALNLYANCRTDLYAANGWTMIDNDGEYWACAAERVALASHTLCPPGDTLPAFPHPVHTVYENPVSAPLIAARSLATSLFNRQPFTQQFALFDSPAPPTFDHTGLPLAGIHDGAGNPAASSATTVVSRISDNDPPNLRIRITDGTRLDVLFEVSGGLVDSRINTPYGTLAPRQLVVSDLRSNTLFGRVAVATTTAVGSCPTGLCETYDLGALAAAPAVGTQTARSDTRLPPLAISAGTRLRITAEAYDNARANESSIMSVNRRPVILQLSPQVTPTATDILSTVFPRDLAGNTGCLRAATADERGNTVIVVVPLPIVAPADSGPKSSLEGRGGQLPPD